MIDVRIIFGRSFRVEFAKISLTVSSIDCANAADPEMGTAHAASAALEKLRFTVFLLAAYQGTMVQGTGDACARLPATDPKTLSARLP